MSDDVGALRAGIDDIDRRILAAVNERLELVDRLWALKAASRVGLVDAGREAEIRRSLSDLNRGPLTPDGLDELVTDVLALCKREQLRRRGRG